MKGFTLVELLAVIVILAVIALIATPIVLSIINDTKESAVIRSAEMYVGAVENKIMQENMIQGGKLNPKDCIVGSDGNVTCDGTPLEIEVNGDKPDSGLITYDRGRVTSIELTFGERKVITDENGELVLDSNTQVCKLIQGEPNEMGSKYECEVKRGTKYNFYVLSHETDGTTNLIMDRNINSDGTPTTKAIYEDEKEDNGGIYNKVAWINQDNYESSGGTIWGDLQDNNHFGPITAMNFLDNATSDWNNIPNLNLTYNDEGEHFTNFKITGKARLPYKSEVNEAGCADDSRFACPLWMVEYLSDGGANFGTPYQENPIDEIYGYWTLSSSSGTSYEAWNVHYEGIVSNQSSVDNGGSYGVRPVINVKL